MMLPLVSSMSFPLQQSRTQFLQWIGMLSISGGDITLEDDASISAICQNGALVPEVAVPGAYNQVCMNLPERILKIDTNSQQVIRIQQQTSGSGKTGLAVWNSGLVLMRLLVALKEQGAIQDWNNQRVLELGCGTGLVSIVASRLGSKSVLATDGNPDVVALTRSNVELNQVQVQSEVLQWGLLNAMDYNEAADIVLGSDLTYNSGTWRVLCETMATVLSPQGFILYLSLGHDGFNVNAEVEGFLNVAREQGLVVVPEIGGMQVSKLLDQIISPLERKLVLQNGVSVVVLQHKRFTKK
jgi:predicted nicotinamide N-methyase